MRVQRMCRKLVLLLLAAACLCQMALAVSPDFLYGSRNRKQSLRGSPSAP